MYIKEFDISNSLYAKGYYYIVRNPRGFFPISELPRNTICP